LLAIPFPSNTEAPGHPAPQNFSQSQESHSSIPLVVLLTLKLREELNVSLKEFSNILPALCSFLPQKKSHG